MATTIQAVKCKLCGKLHPENGRYISIISLSIVEHRTQRDLDSYSGSRTPTQAVQMTDVVVCDNNCLKNLLSLKGYG